MNVVPDEEITGDIWHDETNVDIVFINACFSCIVQYLEKEQTNVSFEEIEKFVKENAKDYIKPQDIIAQIHERSAATATTTTATTKTAAAAAKVAPPKTNAAKQQVPVKTEADVSKDKKKEQMNKDPAFSKLTPNEKEDYFKLFEENVQVVGQKAPRLKSKEIQKILNNLVLAEQIQGDDRVI